MKIPAEVLIREHMAAAARFVASEAEAMFRHRVPLIIKCQHIHRDSPLEELFHLWWVAFTLSHAELIDSFPYSLVPILRHHEVVIVGDDRFELDFSIRTDHPRFQKLAVELDGHAFHERTREQVSKRDKRDRALQSDGWFIFHFSFSEFTSEPQRCAGEVFDRVYDQIVGVIHSEPFSERATA